MNPYRVLGVKKNASKEEIKKAFRDLVKKHHPDVGGDEEKFKKITEANKILSNDENRDFYDKYGTVKGSEEHEIHIEVTKIFKELIKSCISNSVGIRIEILKTSFKKEEMSLLRKINEIESILRILNENKKIIKPKKRRKINHFKFAMDELIEEHKDFLFEHKEELKRLKKKIKIIDSYETNTKTPVSKKLFLTKNFE